MTAGGSVTGSTLPADDRGLNYGDGLFETMRAVDGTIPLLERHLARLRRSADRLGIPLPSEESLSRAVGDVAQAVDDGVVKLVLTRGSGGRGYRPPDEVRPRVLVSRHELPDIPRHWYRRGVNVRICATRIGRNPATAGLKHLGRLEQVLASAELGDDEDEGLMLDEQDHVIEGTRSNLFACVAGTLLTPPVHLSGVAGVMRELVMEWARRAGMACREEDMGLDALGSAEEILLTNSVLGILPVAEIPALQWRTGRGAVCVRFMNEASALGVPGWAP